MCDPLSSHYFSKRLACRSYHYIFGQLDVSKNRDVQCWKGVSSLYRGQPFTVLRILFFCDFLMLCFSFFFPPNTVLHPDWQEILSNNLHLDVSPVQNVLSLTNVA